MRSGASVYFNPGLPDGSSTQRQEYQYDKQELILRNPLGIWVLKRRHSPRRGIRRRARPRWRRENGTPVQLALNSMLRSKNVLHVSLQDP